MKEEPGRATVELLENQPSQATESAVVDQLPPPATAEASSTSKSVAVKRKSRRIASRMARASPATSNESSLDIAPAPVNESTAVLQTADADIPNSSSRPAAAEGLPQSHDKPAITASRFVQENMETVKLILFLHAKECQRKENQADNGEVQIYYNILFL